MAEKATRYKGIQITTRPAIDRPFDPDVTYYADARHIFHFGDEPFEKVFHAGGHSREEAVRNLKMEVEEFLIEQKYGVE